MALLCNDCQIRDRRIWCNHTGQPCGHVRYCAVSMKYYQTDNAKNCRLRRLKNEQRTERETGQNDQD